MSVNKEREAFEKWVRKWRQNARPQDAELMWDGWAARAGILEDSMDELRLESLASDERLEQLLRQGVAALGERLEMIASAVGRIEVGLGGTEEPVVVPDAAMKSPDVDWNLFQDFIKQSINRELELLLDDPWGYSSEASEIVARMDYLRKMAGHAALDFDVLVGTASNSQFELERMEKIMKWSK
jgi:hypothetical protein